MEWKPPAAAPGGGDSGKKKSASPAPQKAKPLAPVEWKGGPLSDDEKAKLKEAAANELDVKIQNCGDHIRKLKGTHVLEVWNLQRATEMGSLASKV